MLFFQNRSSGEPLSEVLKEKIIVSSQIQLTNLMDEAVCWPVKWNDGSAFKQRSPSAY
jgi:hypothetical protein